MDENASPAARVREGAERRFCAADLWLIPFLIGYAGFLVRLYAPLTDTEDGITGIMEALHLGGLDLPQSWSYFLRPPIGSLLLLPFVTPAYRSGGAEAALAASHAVLIAATTLFVALSWVLYRRFFDRPLSAALALLTACNPIVLCNAPLASCDAVGALCAVLFLLAALRQSEEPGSWGFLALAVSSALAYLSKYHQGILLAAPALAALLSRPMTRSDGGLSARYPRAALAAAPVLGLAVAFAVLVLMRRWDEGDTLSEALAYCVSQIARHSSEEVVMQGGLADFLNFPRSLAYSLGPALTVLAAVGAALWLKRRGRAGRFLFAALALSVATLVGFIKTRNARFLLFVVPLAYTAAGETVSAASERVPKRALLFSGLLVLAGPWNRTVGVTSELIAAPAFRSRLPFEIARYAPAKADEASCLWWVQGELRFQNPKDILIGGFVSAIIPSTLPFFGPADVREVDSSFFSYERPPGPLQGPCRPYALFVPKFPSQHLATSGADHYGPGRWRGPELARLYEVPEKAVITADDGGFRLKEGWESFRYRIADPEGIR